MAPALQTDSLIFDSPPISGLQAAGPRPGEAPLPNIMHLALLPHRLDPVA